MKLAITVTHPLSGRSSDLALEIDPKTRVESLIDHVGDLLDIPQPERGSVFVGTDSLDPQTEVGGSEILDGSEVAIGSARPYPPRPFEDHPALRIVAGVGAGTIFYLSPGRSVLGTHPDASLRVGDPSIPPFAAWLTTTPNNQVQLTPSRDTQVFLAGDPVTATTALTPETEIRVGDTLFELGLPQRSDAAVTRSDVAARLDYTRPPRLFPPLQTSSFKLPSPPKEAQRRAIPIITVVAPLVLAGVMAVALKQPSFLGFAVLSPVMLVVNQISDRKNGRVSFRKQREDYEKLKALIESDATEALARERVERRREAPDAATLLEIAVGLRSRLWERRRADDDYLSVRVGVADLPSTVVLDDPEELEHRRSVTQVASDVPVVVNISQAGVVGIAGQTPAAQNLAGWLLGQLAVLQSPRDTSFYVLTDSRSASSWSWLRWLPHARPSLGQDAAVLVGNDAETLGRRVAELTQLLDARARAGARAQSTDPDIVVVIDGARRLRALPGLIRILKDGPTLGVYAICIDTDRRLLPEECTAVVVIQGVTVDLLEQRKEDVLGARTDILPEAWFSQVARSLSPLVDINEDAAAGALPGASRLVDVLRLDPPTEDAIVARWLAGGRTTEVVVGESLDGAFSFDLRRDGPHGLVAGTTGSGKSELLQTIVASLAVANRPDAMTFVLVDYKGGAAFKDCVKLPHTVGMVTDLDTHLVERALESLGAELRRREHLLAGAEAKDIEDYTELADRSRNLEPLPRLLIVIDEFASMVRELPDFVAGLVNVAQRGRSLGIHLILATQRPSGVISPEIRANTNLRIALRVTDTSESTDVIDAPDSAQISKATPGRGYIRLGASALLPFQSGRVGGRRRSAASAVDVPVWSDEIRWETLGRPASAPPATEQGFEQETDLQALVEVIRSANDKLGIPPQHEPWLDALSKSVLFDSINEFALDDSTSTGWSIAPLPYGLQDLPARQEQRTAMLDLNTAGHQFIAGAPRSGRSQVLRTLAGAIARNTSPADVHVYALDCGNGALIPLDDMPHTGAVVLRTQADRAQRLLAKLGQEVQHRQEVLSAGGYADITEQRQRVEEIERLPHIVFFIDRWEGFTASFGELDGGAMIDQVLSLLREGASLGIHLVVTGDRQLLSGRLGSLVEDKLVLRQADRGDFSSAGLNPRKLPDEISEGRGFVAESGIETQVALLVADPTGQAQSGALVDLAAFSAKRDAAIPRNREAFRLDILPTSLQFEDAWNLRGEDQAGLWAMVGVGGDELLAVGPTLNKGNGTFIVAGPPRSGKSTVLLTMVRSLTLQGGEVVIIAPRVSPLRDLTRIPGVISVVPDVDVTAEMLEALMPPEATGRVLFIDDGELVKDTVAKPWFTQFAKTCSDRAQGLVLGGTLGEVASGITGWQVDLKRGRRGALLSPQSVGDGDLIGIRLNRSALSDQVQPGRALVNIDGVAVSVQVPVA